MIGNTGAVRGSSAVTESSVVPVSLTSLTSAGSGAAAFRAELISEAALTGSRGRNLWISSVSDLWDQLSASWDFRTRDLRGA